MNMENIIAEQWLREMESELKLLDGVETTPVERLRHSMPLITRIIADVKKWVLDEGFRSTETEIYFFKHIKPRFYAHQIYELLYYNLRMQLPEGTPEMIRTFYEEEFQQVIRLFRVEGFHYQYYKTKATELDHLYFLRDATPTEAAVPDLIDPPPGFSTAMDYRFAKFIAYERLRDYLLEQLTNELVRNRIVKVVKENDVELNWTGDSINLVEIGYGIWLTGQVNNGNASITEILAGLENCFRVKIGTAFRRWQSISRRKRISMTKYLDEMKEALIKRLDDENGK
jgi:hypothetical protein